MKAITTCIILLFISLFASAQLMEGSVSLNRVDRPALIGYYDYAPDIIRTVIMDDLKLRGFGEGSGYKGFKMFTGINFALICSDPIDLYLKVDKKSRQEKDRSVVYLVVAKGYDNFISSSNEPSVVEAEKAYLNSLSERFSQQKLKVSTDEQQTVVKKAENKLNSLTKKGESLQKRLESLQNTIVQNQKAIEDQRALLEKEQQKLNDLKLQIK